MEAITFHGDDLVWGCHTTTSSLSATPKTVELLKRLTHTPGLPFQEACYKNVSSKAASNQFLE
jgi:hypothetical protein